MTSEAPTLLILVSEERVFWSHRRPMAEAARKAGFKVSVATHLIDDGSALRDAGYEPIALAWKRADRGPVATARAVLEIARIYRDQKPDIAHHFSVQAAIVGGLAARIGGQARTVTSLTGLGTAFLASGWKAALRRRLVSLLMRVALKGAERRLIVQNGDDKALAVDIGFIPPERLSLIPGSGVDVDHFAVLPAPEGEPVIFAYIGRLIVDKGLDALINAARRLKAQSPVRVWLVGDRDDANEGGYALETVQAWEEEGLCEWRGPSADVREIWAQAHVAVLPSRREGMPLSLLEAAACGRPMLAADAPGSRDLVEPFTNGLLHPVDDDQALAEAMAVLAADASLRARFGMAARAKVERDMSATAVGDAAVALYRDMLAPR